MNFHSTRNKSVQKNFRQAVIKSLADDGGLYFPSEIPKLPQSFFDALPNMSIPDIAYEILKPYAGSVISDADLKALTRDALNFDFPLVKVEDNIYALELFHGPTLAFKDVGARITARFMGRFAENQEITVLVATSGDTGSAVANGFWKVPGVNVVVLYPKGMVSKLQEKQFATLGDNITALAVSGTFDDCQSLVKQAFSDTRLNQNIQLTSANSISLARLLPQMTYFFYAYARISDKSKPLTISVPSGNYGNMTAGLIAKAMGLPVAHFIASANINDIVPEYLETKKFNPRKSESTISNAMDVGNPSNFERMLELYEHSWDDMSKDITGYSFTDDETRAALKDLFERTGYTCDPHGAVGYLGLKSRFASDQGIGIFLETAHPAKFHDTVEAETGRAVPIPSRLEKFMHRDINAEDIAPDFNTFKTFLTNRFTK